MKVILQQDIKALGKKGQIVEVSDGHARNLLLPKKMAIEANTHNLTIQTAHDEATKRKKMQEIEQIKQLAEKINTLSVKIKIKAGENGKTFGSITAKEIAEQLKQQHQIDIDKKKIMLEESIKTVGVSNVSIHLYEGINTVIKVVIEGM